MPRNAAGVYTLPSGNPVVPNTTIATTWANPTLADVAQALTDSLDRNGLGGMLVSFRIADGIASAPGLAFTNELGMGLWRSAAGTMNYVVGGTNYFTFGPDKVISPIKAEFRGLSTYMLTGAKNWKLDNQAGALVLTPSATINAEDWDNTKDTVFGSDGSVTISGTLNIGALAATTLTVVGTATVGALTTAGNVSAANVTASGRMTADAYTQSGNTGNITGATNVDYNVAQSHMLTLTGAAVITPTNVPVGSIMRIILKSTQLGVTWAASVKWAGGGTPPDLAAGALDIAVVGLTYDGTNHLASAAVY